jgi:hypothetical protein
VQRRIGLGVLGDDPSRSGRELDHQRVMPSVHGQAKVGQNGQKKAAVREATGSRGDEAMHPITIVQLRWRNHK